MVCNSFNDFVRCINYVWVLFSQLTALVELTVNVEMPASVPLHARSAVDPIACVGMTANVPSPQIAVTRAPNVVNWVLFQNMVHYE